MAASSGSGCNSSLQGPRFRGQTAGFPFQPHYMARPDHDQPQQQAGTAASAAPDDPELDFFSPQFNALKALSAAGLRPPDTRARPLDNLYRCRTLLPAEHPDAMQLVQRGPKSREAVEAAERARQRTSYVAQQRERSRPKINPLDEIAERVREGPLLLLKRAYTERTRVRVVTRHGRGVRGFAEGTLVAFDKYFNLVLRDVEEAYTVLLRGIERPAGPGGTKLRRAPKQEHRQRKLKQVFLRGDNVVLVSGPLAAAQALAGRGPATAAAGLQAAAPVTR